MTNKVKVIELLNKIANKEEVPKKLLYKFCGFKNKDFYEEYLLNWSEKYKAYFYISNIDSEEHPIVDLLPDNLWNLNDELEIIEEIEKPKEIELLEINGNKIKVGNAYCSITKSNKKLAKQQNEIARAVNYLLKKEDDSNK